VKREVKDFVLPILVLSLTLPGCAGTPQRAETEEAAMPSQAHAETVGAESAATQLDTETVESGEVMPRREPEISLGSGSFINRSAASRQGPAAAEGDVTLNFDNTAITEVVKVVLGDILGENYVIDPNIKGNVSLNTSQPVKRDALIPILEELLKMNGAAMSWDGAFYRVAPLSAAVRSGLSPRLAQRGAQIEPGYGVQILPLRYIAAKEMMKILESMVPKENLLLVDDHRNLLVLGGTSTELEGWRDTVEIFDVDWMAGYSVGVFPLQYADAKTIGEELTRIISEHMNADSANMVKIEALDRLNALLVLTPQQRYLERMRVWIERLDRVGDEPGVRLYTYEVKNRKAAELAAVLTDVFSGEGGGVRTRSSALAPGMKPVKLSSVAAGGKEGTATPSDAGGQLQSIALPAGGQVRIVADDSNNSILVMASAQDYLVIESALKRLDVQEMQVLIEASILEVSLTDELSYGLEWYFKNNDVYKGKLGEGLLDLDNKSGIGAIIPGFSYTISGNSAVSAVLNALASDSKLNVISSPSLMVLDNRTARITVGDQVPVKSETATTEAGVIIESIQFKDTGVQLEVTPRINSGGLITMEIRQDVTDVGEPEAATGQRSFRQRNIQSTIAIQNGDTIMLGGLITENATGSESGVPYLRDIPLLGALFGKTSESNRRTELVVLITPRVVQNSSDARLLTEEYRKRMNSLKLQAEKTLAMPTTRAH